MQIYNCIIKTKSDEMDHPKHILTLITDSHRDNEKDGELKVFNTNNMPFWLSVKGGLILLNSNININNNNQDKEKEEIHGDGHDRTITRVNTFVIVLVKSMCVIANLRQIETIKILGKSSYIILSQANDIIKSIDDSFLSHDTTNLSYLYLLSLMQKSETTNLQK
ncbi:hypothetical protein RFI_37222 [Reticulomyxa filosa]|uniref:Uncharacterized protein n=1 Tax=Reticulomyxa filosa TaxID=46433 RepID=X6LHM2_RETFI|nr:hypothetical protein RFI_37222 [Reticulomyxa filosa]|eukprot:ETO00225.1 hypothetical protein RFI_37222 [Reticulomyxa filosa]